MTATSPSGHPLSVEGDPPGAVRIPASLQLDACERLVSGDNRRHAATNLIRSANSFGIDLELMWGVLAEPGDTRSPRVRQVCLAVLGAGRTAMLFHSSPEATDRLGPPRVQCGEIRQCMRACLRDLGSMPERAALAQCLIEPTNAWASEVCRQAGMISVGELAYLRKPLPPRPALQRGRQASEPPPPPDWGAGITVRPIRSLNPDDAESDYAHLSAALERSYEDTLDCPELCGLRSMRDIIDSHKATGVFDPRHWLLIFRDGDPVGCCLLSHCPTSASIELVYLGIGPSGRGLGLGRRVLEYGIERMRRLVNAREVTCAVDTRNAPALAVYASLGFSRFDARLGFVAPLPLR